MWKAFTCGFLLIFLFETKCPFFKTLSFTIHLDKVYGVLSIMSHRTGVLQTSSWFSYKRNDMLNPMPNEVNGKAAISGFCILPYVVKQGEGISDW